MATEKELKATLLRFDQGHLVEALEKQTLTVTDHESLLQDLLSIDFEEMCGNFQKSGAAHPPPSTTANGHIKELKSIDDRMEPIEDDLCASVNKATADELHSYLQISLEEISQSHVGVLLLAGGQGTRLGVPYPKGMYDISLPSRKTLYQIQVERILRLQKMAQELTGVEGNIVMYVMTSEHTKQPTEKFFKEHNYFGMKEKNVVFFEQRMIPCFDFKGRIILETPTSVARAPDGNGGLYWALKHENILQHMEETGIQYLHVYCVDNVLVKVADPIFMGYCISKKAESGNKVVEKVAPEEAVGVVCRVDGKFQVVEYSEIGKDNAAKRAKSGKLLYCAGNICNHFFTTPFLRKICDNFDHLLPHHVAKKKIPSIDCAKPESPNGIKLEKFVFDVFQFSNNFVVWECRRDEEFSPLKNADKAGASDTPTTARESLLKLHKKYIEDVGGQVKEGCSLEISPLLSYSGENLQLKGSKSFNEDTVILD